MQLIYNGPHPEVVVDELDDGLVITAGQPVEIPDDLAARLLEQSTWSRDVSSISCGDLNAQAAAVGVDDPHKLPSKQAVADAIAEVSTEPAPSEVPASDSTTEPDASADTTTKGDS